MEVLHPRCCGLDVHKQTVVACVRLVIDGKPVKEVRTFATTNGMPKPKFPKRRLIPSRHGSASALIRRPTVFRTSAKLASANNDSACI
jgi:hypothetical protein